MVVITVEVISDIVCVWCFIGKRTLEKAIALYQKTYPGGKNDTFTIKWRPYLLNYNPSIQSVEKSEIAKVKFQEVPPDKMAAMRNRVNQVGLANGIEFSFGGKIGSTREAHRLIHLTQMSTSPEIQDAFVEKLFHAYHEKEMDISDTEVLKRIAVDAGLKMNQVSEWLNSNQGREEVEEEALTNRQKVITGVPTFFVQNIYRVDGAQDLQEFFDAFVKVKESERSPERSDNIQL